MSRLKRHRLLQLQTISEGAKRERLHLVWIQVRRGEAVATAPFDVVVR